MTESPIRWTAVASFPGRFLAEVTIRTLEAEEIPVLVKGEEPGIWGPGFTGLTPQGIEILVPAECAEEASEIIAQLGAGADPSEGWEPGEND